MWRIAERITAPSLVITGRQDRLVDVRVAPAVGTLIPDSRLLVLDQVGHVAQMERPDLVARGVLAMLDEVGSGNGAPVSPATVSMSVGAGVASRQPVNDPEPPAPDPLASAN
jgi:hypothetical protein